MKDREARELIDDIKASYRRREANRSAPAGAGVSAPALEATLADISAEVTKEALERKQRSTKL